MDWSIVGQKIKQQRKKQKITQLDLANLIGKTESSVRKYEKGLVNIPTDVLELIAEKLDITPFALIGPEWWDIQMGPERAEKLHRAVTVERGIIAMLEEIYGGVESKEVLSERSTGAGHYYLVGKAPNTFVLYDNDINALEQATKASFPALIDRMKDTRPEDEIILEYQKELDQQSPPQDE